VQSDRTPITGALGFVATLTLGEVNALVGILVGLATLGFILTRWLYHVKARGGYASLFAPASPPVARPCPDCPAVDRVDR
jgi:hypothetical protein